MMKETKELLALVFSLAKAGGQAMEDGKVDYSDITVFIPVLSKIGPGVTGLQDVVPELKKAGSPEYEELAGWAKKEFDIPQDELEAKIELGFDAALALIRLVVAFRKAA